ncbi:MAG: molybdopterin-guanine dinucleotide biosynthesis protein B [Desulfamplus sp.]|nr:molybdopterin-guanine dinucleotide biosynthesis protein B [Desulfamplus sp.]MBF0257714.1 molybdopterin-guanine dinucleotide biosynthesis protein B [Desulfamplus sp.]
MKPNIISIAGRSGSGKTTFLEKLIPKLKQKGFHIGIIKHAHCGVDMDKKGKDSWRHKNAGAAATLVVSPGTISMIKDYKEPDFSQNDDHSIKKDSGNIRESGNAESESATIARVKHYLADMDLIIVEGFKFASLPKLEIFRTGAGHDAPLFIGDKNLEAFITDSDYRPNVPCFSLDDAEAVSDFIEKKYIL